MEPDYKKLYEEEHRKYEESLSRAKGLLDGIREEGYNIEEEDIKNLFPGEELEEKEPEDEKIRKYIMDIVKGHCNGGVEYKKCIDWLNKKGEQKSSWSEEDEDMLKSIIATCELAEKDRDSSPARHLLEMQINWLKSLKDRIMKTT